jgi:amino acid transporter
MRIGSRKKGTTLSKSKKMGVVQLTTVTAINMMGSGIILLPATLAEIGTISIFAWILASIGATILAYAFARCGMHTSKVGGMGGYAEYRFGRAGNFLSNFCYTISLIIANAAIASGVVSYATYVFGLTLSPVEVCMATISVLLVAATISLVGPKKFGKFSSLGVFCVVAPVVGLLLCGFFFFDTNIYREAWNPGNLPFYETMKDSIAVIIWAFLGLETACANSDTVEKPGKKCAHCRPGRYTPGRCLLHHLHCHYRRPRSLPGTHELRCPLRTRLCYHVRRQSRIHRFLHARMLLLRISYRMAVHSFRSSPRSLFHRPLPEVPVQGKPFPFSISVCRANGAMLMGRVKRVRASSC